MSNPETPTKSFIALMALLMSLIALSIDTMIPALAAIGADLQVQRANDVQLVVSSLFLGLGFGMLFFGPFSDSFGRKPAIYLGIAIFLLGCLGSIFAASFELMLLGRFLQGFGGAACRIITLAIIRDRYSGAAMARILSMVMIIFILVPAIAPSVGQLILWLLPWRAIFGLMLVLALVGWLWFYWQQEETLPLQRRLPFNFRTIGAGAWESLTNRYALGYCLVGGLVFAAFVAYLSSAQQILQEQYALGAKFALAFGCLALFIGGASYVNTILVARYRLEGICFWALVLVVVSTVLFLPWCYSQAGHPPLAALLAYLGVVFFFYGLLFSNFGSLAVRDLGHIAGVANSVVSFLQTLISTAIGAFVGASYNGTVLPLVLSFLIMSLLATLIVLVVSEGGVGVKS